jgi:hypothetical protein
MLFCACSLNNLYERTKNNSFFIVTHLCGIRDFSVFTFFFRSFVYISIHPFLLSELVAFIIFRFEFYIFIRRRRRRAACMCKNINILYKAFQSAERFLLCILCIKLCLIWVNKHFFCAVFISFIQFARLILSLSLPFAGSLTFGWVDDSWWYENVIIMNIFQCALLFFSMKIFLFLWCVCGKATNWESAGGQSKHV